MGLWTKFTCKLHIQRDCNFQFLVPKKSHISLESYFHPIGVPATQEKSQVKCWVRHLPCPHLAFKTQDSFVNRDSAERNDVFLSASGVLLEMYQYFLSAPRKPTLGPYGIPRWLKILCLSQHVPDLSCGLTGRRPTNFLKCAVIRLAASSGGST